MAIFCYLLAILIISSSIKCNDSQKFDSIYPFTEDVYSATNFKKYQKFEYESKSGKKVFKFGSSYFYVITTNLLF